MAKTKKKKKKLRRILSPEELHIQDGTIATDAAGWKRLIMGQDVFSCAARYARVEKIAEACCFSKEFSRKEAKKFVESMTQKVNDWREELEMKKLS